MWPRAFLTAGKGQALDLNLGRGYSIPCKAIPQGPCFAQGSPGEENWLLPFLGHSTASSQPGGAGSDS